MPFPINVNGVYMSVCFFYLFVCVRVQRMMYAGVVLSLHSKYKVNRDQPSFRTENKTETKQKGNVVYTQCGKHMHNLLGKISSFF